jgi:hypothetical protein
MWPIIEFPWVGWRCFEQPSWSCEDHMRTTFFMIHCYMLLWLLFFGGDRERERDFSSAGCKESLTWKLRLKLSIHIYLWCLISSGSIAMILFNVYPFLLSVFSLFGKDPERLEKDSWEEHMTCCGSYMSVFILWISVVTFLVFRCFNIRVENVYVGNIFRCFGVTSWGFSIGFASSRCGASRSWASGLQHIPPSLVWFLFVNLSMFPPFYILHFHICIICNVAMMISYKVGPPNIPKRFLTSYNIL